jgi:hypothetical protein
MVAAQTIPPSGESTLAPPTSNSMMPVIESVLDPELTEFCTRLHITPDIREFHDVEDDDIDPRPYVFDQSSDISDSDKIEKESRLKTFLEAFRKTQVAPKTENKNKKGKYSKRSKRTLKRHRQVRIDLAAKGFPSVDEYFKPKNVVNLVEDESEEGSDVNTPTQGVDGTEVESESQREGKLPVHNVQARMESEESSGDDDGNGVCVQVHLTRHWHACMESEESCGDNNENGMSKDDTWIGDEEEARTAKEHLEALRHEAILAHQRASQGTPNSTYQLLGDHSRLREASAQLTEEAKQGNLNAIVRARVAAMIGLLNLYTDEKMNFSWIKASEVIAKAQGREINHVQHIREWAIQFLKSRDLPLHQLNWKRPTILDDEDIAEEIKSRMAKRVNAGFLKAEDVIKIVASPEVQSIFAWKGISKASISVTTALRWLEKLGWTYGTLKNGMYLDGHERPDVVEYRERFVEHWMGYERRFH